MEGRRLHCLRSLSYFAELDNGILNYWCRDAKATCRRVSTTCRRFPRPNRNVLMGSVSVYTACSLASQWWPFFCAKSKGCKFKFRSVCPVISDDGGQLHPHVRTCRCLRIHPSCIPQEMIQTRTLPKHNQHIEQFSCHFSKFLKTIFIPSDFLNLFAVTDFFSRIASSL